MKRTLIALAATAAAFAVAPAANAATLLTFGQAGQGSPITATANGAQTQTTIAANNVGIDITQLFGSGAGTLSAFLNLSATSTGNATNVAGFIAQMYSGTFSIWSGAGNTGTNYLSGTFSGANFGSAGGASTTLSGSQPGFNVTFTSSYFGTVLPDRAVSFSFANVSPGLGICGNTVCGFTSSVSGTFSGGVPEPATWGLMLLGFGAVGSAMRRRQRVAVRYA